MKRLLIGAVLLVFLPFASQAAEELGGAEKPSVELQLVELQLNVVRQGHDQVLSRAGLPTSAMQVVGATVCFTSIETLSQHCGKIMSYAVEQARMDGSIKLYTTIGRMADREVYYLQYSSTGYWRMGEPVKGNWCAAAPNGEPVAYGYLTLPRN